MALWGDGCAGRTISQKEMAACSVDGLPGVRTRRASAAGTAPQRQRVLLGFSFNIEWTVPGVAILDGHGQS